MSKKSTLNNLILFSLISFGISGSISHIFNIAIVVILAFNLLIVNSNFSVELSSKKLYFALSSVFFIFMIRGIFHNDTWDSLESLSPMLPIPIIGLAILLSTSDRVGISAHRLENNAKIAIVITLLIYIIFSKSLAFKFGLTQLFLERLEMFSGNPIPFSTVVFGITLFCLANWKNSKITEKFITVACLLIGFWLAGIASGTRGTLLAILISTPILIWLTTQSFSLALFTPFIVGVIFWLLLVTGVSKLDSNYAMRLSNGIETFVNANISDQSVKLRMEMWSASVSTIKDNLFWGHDISNRFKALSSHLPGTFKINYSHPHNDIFAGAIGVGLVGGLFSIISLLSPLLASLFSKNKSKEKLFLAIAISLGIFITANVNTIFFNDITAAWLAFSTFLIWNLNYAEKGAEP